MRKHWQNLFRWDLISFSSNLSYMWNPAKKLKSWLRKRYLQAFHNFTHKSESRSQRRRKKCIKNVRNSWKIYIHISLRVLRRCLSSTTMAPKFTTKPFYKTPWKINYRGPSKQITGSLPLSAWRWSPTRTCIPWREGSDGTVTIDSLWFLKLDPVWNLSFSISLIKIIMIIRGASRFLNFRHLFMRNPLRSFCTGEKSNEEALKRFKQCL